MPQYCVEARLNNDEREDLSHLPPSVKRAIKVRTVRRADMSRPARTGQCYIRPAMYKTLHTLQLNVRKQKEVQLRFMNGEQLKSFGWWRCRSYTLWEDALATGGLDPQLESSPSQLQPP